MDYDKPGYSEQDELDVIDIQFMHFLYELSNNPGRNGISELTGP